MQTRRTWRSVFAILLTLAMLAGMLSVMGALPAAAKTTDAMKFKADFSELAAIATEAGAFGESTYYRPGYKTNAADIAIDQWVDEKFDVITGYGINIQRQFLGQSLATLQTSKDTWSGENYWSVSDDGSIYHTTKNSGQMFRLVEAFVPKVDGEQAVLENFEAKVTLVTTGPGTFGNGFIVAFHQPTAGFLRGTGDHRFRSGIGSFVALGNGYSSYNKADSYGVAVYDQNNTLGTDGATVAASLSGIVVNTVQGTNKASYTVGSADEAANHNVDGELLSADNDIQANTKYDLTVKVVGKAVTVTVTETGTDNVLYTRETALNQAGSGYLSIGSSNYYHKIYNIEIQELDENGDPVDFGTNTGKDSVETLKIDFTDVPELYYSGKYYYNANHDTADMTADANDMATDMLTAGSTSYTVDTQDTILVDYLESKFAFYYAQEGTAFERFNVNGYVVDSKGTELTSKASATGTAKNPDTGASSGDGIDGVGPTYNSGTAISKWSLYENKWISNNVKTGDHAFRSSEWMAIKDLDGELLQIDNFKLEMDFSLYADGTYDHNLMAVRFRADTPYGARNKGDTAMFALSPYGGYLLGDDLATAIDDGQYIFNKSGSGDSANSKYDAFTTDNASVGKSVLFTYGTAKNTNTSTNAKVWPKVLDTALGHGVDSHLTLTVVNNTVTVKVTKLSDGSVYMEDTATLSRTGAGYLTIGGAGRVGWFADIEVTRLDVNGNPVDFSDDNEGFTFGESFDAVATYYDGTYYRDTEKDVFWLEGSNASEYTFDAPATYTDDADAVAHLKSKFGLYAYFGGGLFKLTEPYQTSEESADTDDGWSGVGGAANYARWYYTADGLTMRTGNNTAAGGEALRKGMALSPKVNGELIHTRNVELTTDFVLTSNSNNYSLVNVSLRTKEEGRIINGNTDGNNKYADHIALQVRPDGINIADGIVAKETTANITAAAGYTAYSDGAKHYNLRVYVKLVNDKLTVKVTDVATAATLYEVTDKAVSYLDKGYVVLSTGQAKASIANLYVNVLDGNGDVIDPATATEATERHTNTFSANYDGFFMYNSAASNDSRVPAMLRDARYLNANPYFGTTEAGYGYKQILDRITDDDENSTKTYLVSDGYTIEEVTEGEGEEMVVVETILKDAEGTQIVSTTEPGIKSITKVMNAEDATVVDGYMLSFDQAYFTDLVADLSAELYDYLNSKYDFYYTDVDTYKGTARNNNWGYEPGSIYTNSWLQWRNSTASYETTDAPVDKNISALVPKDEDGAALMGSDFSWTQVVRLSDAGTYGTAYLGFNMPTVGKMGGAQVSNQVITFDPDVNVIKVHDADILLWNGSEWTSILPTDSGYADIAKKCVTLNVSVVDGILNGTASCYSESTATTTVFTLNEATLTNTAAGYFAYGFNASGVNMGKITLNVTDAKKMATARQYEGGNIVIQRVTSDVAGVYKYIATATAKEGWELKANTLVAVDESGNTVYPAKRVGFQEDITGGNSFYFYSADDLTFTADFYTAHTLENANLTNLGTSYHEASAGLRFVSRVHSTVDEAGVRYLDVDGTKYEIADYGMIFATQAGIDWGTANSKGTELVLNPNNPYIRAISVLNAGKYFDYCAEYVDISTRVVGLDEANALDTTIFSRAYVTIKLADGSTETVYTDVFDSTYKKTSGLMDTVYVNSATGSDNNAGTADAPVASLEKAMAKVINGGNVVISGTVSAASAKLGTTSGKAVTVSGGTLDVSAFDAVSLTSPLTLKGMTLVVKDGGRLYANGYTFIIESDVTVNGTLQYVFGGANGAYVANTRLFLSAGNYYNIYGGSNGADVGTTEVYVAGNVNTALKEEAEGGSHNVRIFGSSSGAGKKADVTNVTLEGNAYAYMIYGGGDTATAAETYVTVNGGEVAQVFGGNQSCSMEGNTDVQLLGGTVTRRIYGGCYNDSNTGTNYVSGNTNVTIGQALNFTMTGTSDSGIDLIGMVAASEGIRAGSRAGTNYADEVSTLYFENATAQSNNANKLGSSADDTLVSTAFGGVSPADTTDSTVVLD